MENRKIIQKMMIEHFDCYGVQVNINQLKIWTEQLDNLDPIEVYSAMKKTWSDSSLQKPAMPSKLIEIIYGFLSPNEAWAKVEGINNNESGAMVWNEETRLSWGDAYNLIRSNDMVAARMTFIESYKRRVSEAIQEKRRPKYSLTLGNREANQTALIEAVQKKQITPLLALSYDSELVIPESVINSLHLESSQKLMLTHNIQESQKTNPENQNKITEMIASFFREQEQNKINKAKQREEEKLLIKKQIQENKDQQIQRLKSEDNNGN